MPMSGFACERASMTSIKKKIPKISSVSLLRRLPRKGILKQRVRNKAMLCTLFCMRRHDPAEVSWIVQKGHIYTCGRHHSDTSCPSMPYQSYESTSILHDLRE
eukprot:3455467-Amphidinium_carterae.3